MSDPEDTAPFTHRPYGSDVGDNPFVSPSGPAAQPSGPSHVTPPPPPPPTVGPVPYGPPTAGQQPWAAGWTPAHGPAYAGSMDHKGATTSLVLGIVSIVAVALTPFCCITLPGGLCAPFAWWIGAKAKRDIDAFPGTYGNRGAAVAGMWMGIVMTVIAFLMIGGFVALIAWIGLSEPSFA